MTRPKTDFANIRCCICGGDKLTSNTACREHNKEGNVTKRWTCKDCYALYYRYGEYSKPEIDRRSLPRRKSPYNDENRCEFIEENKERCQEKLSPKNARYFKVDKKDTWFCDKHGKIYYQRYNPNSTNNIMKSMASIRIGNIDQNSQAAKGESDVEIVCELYGWKDLNKKYDNYGTPIDCLDEKTGYFYQVRGASLGTLATYLTNEGEEKCTYGWSFSSLEREWKKKYKSMILVCKNKNGKIVERIYKIPSNEIYDGVGRWKKGIGIVKSPRDKYGGSKIPWYEKYIVGDIEELIEANSILERLTQENNCKYHSEI